MAISVVGQKVLFKLYFCLCMKSVSLDLLIFNFNHEYATCCLLEFSLIVVLSPDYILYSVFFSHLSYFNVWLVEFYSLLFESTCTPCETKTTKRKTFKNSTFSVSSIFWATKQRVYLLIILLLWHSKSWGMNPWEVCSR